MGSTPTTVELMASRTVPAGLASQSPEHTFDRLFGQPAKPLAGARPGLTQTFSSTFSDFGWTQSLAATAESPEMLTGPHRGKRWKPARDSALCGHFIDSAEDEAKPWLVVEKEMKNMIGKTRRHQEPPVGRDGGQLGDVVAPSPSLPRNASIRRPPKKSAPLCGSMLRGSPGPRPVSRGAEDKVVLSDEPEVRPNMPDILMRKEVALDRKYKMERFNNIRCFADPEKNRSCAALRSNVPGGLHSNETLPRGLVTQSGCDSGCRRIASAKVDHVSLTLRSQ